MRNYCVPSESVNNKSFCTDSAQFSIGLSRPLKTKFCQKRLYSKGFNTKSHIIFYAHSNNRDSI